MTLVRWRLRLRQHPRRWAAGRPLIAPFIFFLHHFFTRVTQRTVDQLITTENSSASGFKRLAETH